LIEGRSFFWRLSPTDKKAFLRELCVYAVKFYFQPKNDFYSIPERMIEIISQTPRINAIPNATMPA
jgi:hypothetical protein